MNQGPETATFPQIQRQADAAGLHGRSPWRGAPGNYLRRQAHGAAGFGDGSEHAERLAAILCPGGYLVRRFGIIDEMNVLPGAEARGTAAETFRRAAT
jgi:hypothetical protein